MKNVKQAWFRLGVGAFHKHFPHLPEVYLCPLCLVGYSEDEIDLLTLEHVPPKSLGGRKLVLTCHNCNNRASGKDGIDTHAKKRENVIDFLAGTLNSPHRARFTINKFSQEVRVTHVAGGMIISGVPKANPSNRGQEIQDALELLSSKDKPKLNFNITLNRDAYTARSASISWLRAGYLVGFAVLGYRYILAQTFERVRDQIANPGDELISGFSMTVPDAAHNERKITQTTHPSWLRAIAIQMGRHVAFLPFDSGDETFYDRLQVNAKQSSNLNVNIAPAIDWPIAPMFLSDFG